jgi:hypothetical protein
MVAKMLQCGQQKFSKTKNCISTQSTSQHHNIIWYLMEREEVEQIKNRTTAKFQ